MRKIKRKLKRKQSGPKLSPIQNEVMRRLRNGGKIKSDGIFHEVVFNSVSEKLIHSTFLFLLNKGFIVEDSMFLEKGIEYKIYLST